VGDDLLCVIQFRLSYCVHWESHPFG